MREEEKFEGDYNVGVKFPWENLSRGNSLYADF